MSARLDTLMAEAREIDLDVKIFRNGSKVHISCFPDGSTNPPRAVKLAEEIADAVLDVYKDGLQEPTE